LHRDSSIKETFVTRTLVAEPEPQAEAEAPAACCTSVAAPEVSGEQAQTLADVFKALADPTRVRIVNMLVNADEAVCVCDFTSSLDLSQPTVSFHLAKLRKAGLLDREQRGTWAYYSLNRSALGRVARVLDLEGGTP
jgi:ArsR family transcriptional regulator, arsenate/arsenite/antimonite-responsive transcriptional repressor